MWKCELIKCSIIVPFIYNKIGLLTQQQQLTLHEIELISQLTGVTMVTPYQLWTSGPTLDPLTSNSVALLMPLPRDSISEFHLQYVMPLCYNCNTMSTLDPLTSNSVTPLTPFSTDSVLEFCPWHITSLPVEEMTNRF